MDPCFVLRTLILTIVQSIWQENLAHNSMGMENLPLNQKGLLVWYCLLILSNARIIIPEAEHLSIPLSCPRFEIFQSQEATKANLKMCPMNLDPEQRINSNA